MTKEIYLAGGCFWGMEHLYRKFNGVTNVTVGYGNIRSAEEADYRTVCRGYTEARETTKIEYDTDKIKLRQLLEIFFEVIDPALINQQGNDLGTQYQSGIYWTDSADEATVRKFIEDAKAEYPVINTEIKPLKNFYKAEEYHQRYLEKKPHGYCHIPLAKMAELAEKYNRKEPKKLLLVIDMQNDFIDGALGTPEAVAIVPAVRQKIEEFDGNVLFTRDTHFEDYMETQEGKNLPVPHCIKGTEGWQIRTELEELRRTEAIDKVTFGSMELGPILQKMNEENPIESITLIGLCTDICVISNAMIAKAFLPEVPIIVDAKCCAGVSVATHENALAAMEVCQIKVVNK